MHELWLVPKHEPHMTVVLEERKRENESVPLHYGAVFMCVTYKLYVVVHKLEVPRFLLR